MKVSLYFEKIYYEAGNEFYFKGKKILDFIIKSDLHE